MDSERPDPDRLLDRLNAEAARAKRGKLKIFFMLDPFLTKPCPANAKGAARQNRWHWATLLSSCPFSQVLATDNAALILSCAILK